jgi:phosphoglucosamine mutase
MTRRYFGTDGVRGRANVLPMTADFALRLGAAAGRYFRRDGSAAHRVVIGKDTRLSGYMFENALTAGFTSTGMNVLLLGPVPTPAVGLLTKSMRADVGVMISASHNPHEDNGIKFFSADGNKLPDRVEELIEAEIDKPMTTVSSAELGKAKRIDDARGRYIEFCKSTIPSRLDFRGLKVVVDCAHGATYHIAPDVLEEIGAEVIVIGAEPNGLNINDGFGATKPRALASSVRVNGADLGIALDGDGDRVIMVDGNGEIVDGDEILYIIARSRLASGGLNGSVVGTHMSNLGLEVALRELGIGFERVAVGDRYILERLAERDWTLGGEPSGHIICRDRTTTGDGIVSALQVLAEINKTGRSLAELRGAMRKFPQELINVPLGRARAAEVMACAPIRDAIVAVEAQMNGDGRVLLRPSGTEPLIRVMVEGREAGMVAATANAIADVVRAQLGT